MFQLMDKETAISLIKDGDCIGINSFLSLNNPHVLHEAVYERFMATGHPRNLRLFCAAGFGGWDKTKYADPYIGAGAVTEIVASHYSSTPEAIRLALEERIEAYCLPLGVLSHALRAAAGGMKGIISKVGLNLYVDPRVGSPALNSISKRSLVELIEINGEEFLYYETPKLDIAFLRGTTVDPNGNISFEKEYLSVDALSMAQATKQNGGKVIVQVERVSHMFSRPRNVIVPGVLVDAVVVSEQDGTLHTPYEPSLSGDIHVPPSQMGYYVNRLGTSRKMKAGGRDYSAEIIGKRAARELKPGQIVNIGIGLPENVGKYAAQTNVLKDVVITVESGGIGGLPAPGVAFGATIGADMICDTATQFDFYDGGGLDICFMGGLEVDMHGNVNSHKLENSFAGIGGFANITHATPVIVFCINFSTKGLIADWKDGRVEILEEGSIPKFRREIGAISFSAKNALERGQRVIYVTERCVFELTEHGLRLKEVYDGVDAQRDVLRKLPFDLVD